MSADELAAALYAEQGYLIIASDDPLTIGEIPAWKATATRLVANTPVRVMAVATEDDFVAQCCAAKRIAGLPGFVVDSPYFYRVEACD